MFTGRTDEWFVFVVGHEITLPKTADAQEETIWRLYDSRELTVKELAPMHSVSSPTVYAALRG